MAAAKKSSKELPLAAQSQIGNDAPSTRNMSKRTSMDHGDPTEYSSVADGKSRKNKRREKQD